MHFLVPGGAGGGWDLTARATGAALREAGLVERVTFENRGGAGGGKGVAHMLETAEQNQHVLMVNSTPIIVRSLNPVFQQSWRSLTPVASVIGDYGAIVVRRDGRFQNWQQLADALQQAPRSVKFAGGSNRGNLDHLILAQVYSALGLEPREARYVPYGGGGAATLALVGGEVEAMAAQVGDALAQVRGGRLRVLAVAAPARIDALPQTPTFRELGLDVTFVNWRGFFAVPGLPDAQRKAFADLLDTLRTTPVWQETLDRYGWVEVFNRGDDFQRYLEAQETLMADLVTRLGVSQ